MRNLERKTIKGTANRSTKNYGNKLCDAYCKDCGLLLTTEEYYWTDKLPAYSRGYGIHERHLHNFTAKSEKCGNKESKTMNFYIFTTVNAIEKDMLTYLHSTTYFNCHAHGCIDMIDSVECINNNAINKILSGLIAFGNNRKITLKFVNGVHVITTMENANDTIELSQRLFDCKTKGECYRRIYNELSTIATIVE